ncbi:hypothetical protein G3570_06645 [Balneolaceae bacterium YR4-1]|uniref:Uncharacterized protein n=1 Tax=Halalkalibaculum roseum TaxID=2709311 RepID=A0A6M1T7Q7_9BACT|nr:hypothetical protein [Halalkalibaculum roseum]NGP76303.1 hypothetical protein [Halalkalibaculum roseum]
MNLQYKKLPEGWLNLITPNLYRYKDFYVRKIDRLDGKVELITNDFAGKRCAVVCSELSTAFKMMEQQLRES